MFEIRKEEYFNKGMMKDAKEVEEAQHMATEALQDDWIPVIEMLPDYRQTVLISTKWGVNIAFRDSVNEGVTDDFWDCPLDDSTIATTYVTAWRPLSKPYKEDKGGGTCKELHTED